MKITNRQSGRKTVSLSNGFTAIELLITLFIAAVFLVSGFQLYNLIIKDGGQTRAQGRASNTTYDYLQRYKPYATYPCTPQTPLTNSAITVTNLSNVTVTVAISCPYGTASTTSKILVTLNYNSPQQVVSNATYVASPGIVTNGLVLNLDAGNPGSYSNASHSDATTWFDLSGNGNNGVLVNGASYTTDGGGSLNFDGVNDRIDLSSRKLVGASGVTMSIWYKTSSTKTYNFLMGKGNLSSGNPLTRVLGMQIYNLHLTFTASQGDNTGWCSQGNNGPVLATDGTWHQVTGTFDLSSQTIKTYVDGALKYTSACNQTGDSEGSDILYIGQDSTLWPSGYFLGQLNDAFVYNRVLSATEVQQNFNTLRGRYGI